MDNAIENNDLNKKIDTSKVNKSLYFNRAGVKRLIKKTLKIDATIASKPDEEIKIPRIASGLVDLICQKLQSDCENYILKLNKLAKHTGRLTLRVEDLELLNELRD